jgi:hypothetical protein
MDWGGVGVGLVEGAESVCASLGLVSGGKERQ